MKQAYEDLKEELKCLKGEHVVVAVSGGVDSMSLLNLMVELKKELSLKVVCAHVNHNVRKESDSEKIFVENYCNQNDVIFEYMKIKNYGNDNFHNEARNIRYTFFEDITHKYNSKYLLTAHHADDLIETILMRLIRGSSFRGYSGFSKKSIKKDYILYRPLITVSKDQIYDYAKENNLEYVQDNSNFKDVYTRNRFRKYVVPLLKKEDENIYNKFYKYSTSILETDEYINKQLDKIKDDVLQNKIIKIDKFKDLEKILKKRIINLLLEQIYLDKISLITDKHTQFIYDLLISSKPNGCISLPDNMVGIKSYEKFFIKEEVDSKEEYNYEIKDIVILPNDKKIEIIDSIDIDDNNICRLNKSSIKLPLFVRNKKDGDKIIIKGMEATKKINEIFINSKIDVESRKLWPVVVDSSDNIVWLPGLKKSKFNSSKEEKCDIILKYY